MAWRQLCAIAAARQAARGAWDATKAKKFTLVGVRDPLIRTLRRWRRYAQAERDGFLLALARRDTTIRRLRTESRRRSTSVASGARVPDGPAGLGHDAEARRRGMRWPTIGGYGGPGTRVQAGRRSLGDGQTRPRRQTTLSDRITQRVTQSSDMERPVNPFLYLRVVSDSGDAT